MPLAKVLIDNKRTACTDIRDKVYGFLGLCSDVTADHSLLVDYSRHNTAETLLYDVVAFCDVHPDSMIAFCHHLRDSLRRTEGFSSLTRSSAGLIIHTRAWKVGVIEISGKPPPDDILDSFCISHATAEYLKMEPASSRRAFKELLIESACSTSKNLKQLDPPQKIDATRLCCPDDMLILGAPGVVQFGVLEDRFNAMSNHSLAFLPSSTFPAIEVYTSTELVSRQCNGGSASHTYILSPARLEPGDIVCQFLGLDTSLVVRKHEDFYLLVGKAYLEDRFHQLFWQGRSWNTFFHKPGGKHPMAPKDLEPIHFVMDYPTLFNLCW
jgi:hypothetical protein